MGVAGCRMPWLTSSRYRNSIDLSAVGSFGPFFPFPLPPFPLPFLPLPYALGGHAQTPHAGARASLRGATRAPARLLAALAALLAFLALHVALERRAEVIELELDRFVHL